MIKPIIQQPYSPVSRGRTGQKPRQEAPSAADFKTPSRADENYVPSEESLSTLIRSAISSLRKGITWDRGSIINLNV